MLILSLTGIWLWWPRNGAFLPGLRWRRSAQTTTNLHHLLGFWISIPLAVVSFTGIYLGFPQTMRQMMSSIAPMNPQGQRPGAGTIARDTRLTPDSALRQPLHRSPMRVRPSYSCRWRARTPATALAHRAPSAKAAERRGEGGSAAGPAWRVQLRNAASGETATVMVDDRSGNVERQPAPLAGDRAAQWIRWIHEGSHSGPVWQFAVFLTGVFPLVFAVTGVDHVVAGQAGPQGCCRAHSRPRRTASSRVKGAAPARRKADLLNSMPLQIIGGTQQRHIETRGWGA